MEAGEAEARLTALPGWSLIEAGTAIHRRYRFADFAGAFAFVGVIAGLAEAAGHHPDLGLGWGYVTVRLRTHDIGGLGDQDFALAALIDQVKPAARQVPAADRGPRVSVRLATPEDAGGVTAALAASFPVLVAGHYDRETLLRSLPLICRANPALLRSGTYFVATEADGSIVGCGGWTPEAPGTDIREPAVGHVRHLAVRAGRTGMGIGRRLYDAAERQAGALGMRRFETYATLNAVGFYRSVGFTEIGPTTSLLGGTVEFPSVHMWRSL